MDELSKQDPPEVPFIICCQCACISFDEAEINDRYCKICKKTHQSAADYFVSNPGPGEASTMVQVFKAFLESRRT